MALYLLRKRTDFIVVHCSATPATHDIGAKDIDIMHRKRGFFRIGYHFVIKRDGTIETGREEAAAGSHVQGYNSVSIGVCLVGGLKEDCKTAENNYTPEQMESLKALLTDLVAAYPNAKVVGHRDLSPDKNGNGKIDPWERVKECPCFDVISWWMRKGEEIESRAEVN